MRTLVEKGLGFFKAKNTIHRFWSRISDIPHDRNDVLDLIIDGLYSSWCGLKAGLIPLFIFSLIAIIAFALGTPLLQKNLIIWGLVFGLSVLSEIINPDSRC